MRFATVSLIFLGSVLLAHPSTAHVALEFPNGGEVYSEGEVVTLQWHIYISHPLLNWDLWYATDNGTTSMLCGNQSGFTWIPIATDIPRTCTNAGGGCTVPGGCTMQYQWTVPAGIDSDQVKIRVRMDNSGADYWDVSNEPFTISSATSSTPDLLPWRGVVLRQSFPNPFRSSSTITYALAEAAEVQLTIHDATGRQVRELVWGSVGAGEHYVIWDGTDDHGSRLPSGTYLYRLVSGDSQMTRKLNLVE